MGIIKDIKELVGINTEEEYDEEEVIEEIARISNGEITNVAKQHALELIMSV